jgi:hypothetical protein
VTPQDLFLARLEALVIQCNEVQKAIKSPGINGNLYQRAATDLLEGIGNEKRRIENLRSITRNGEIAAGSWETLQANGEKCATLFGECLGFLQASRARGHDVDADLCEIADALLDEFSELTRIKWSRFTVLATEEFFLDLAQIIRLRFPFSGIWDLPVAAHEFGHFVAGRLNAPRPDGSRYLPFQDEKKNFKEQHKDFGEEWMFYLEEYFADVFATFVLGPAYAFTCLLLRFDPASAQDENDKRHPSYVKRVYAILQTLRRMNSERDSKGDFKNPADFLANLWNRMLVSAGQTAVLTKDEEVFVGGIVSNFYEILKGGIPGARFNRWDTVRKRCPWVENPNRADVRIVDLTISDLLNAAWLCRTKEGADSGQLSDNVIQLSRLQSEVSV